MNRLEAAIECVPCRTVSVPAQGSISTTAGTALADNPGFIGTRTIQNTGATVLKITLGSTVPTQTVYHYALAACTTGDDGKGGAWFSDTWSGPVQIISDAVGGTYVAAEISR